MIDGYSIRSYTAHGIATQESGMSEPLTIEIVSDVV